MGIRAGTYTGVVGAFLYVLGCREPLPGLHERYVANPWRQTLGSTAMDVKSAPRPSLPVMALLLFAALAAGLTIAFSFGAR